MLLLQASILCTGGPAISIFVAEEFEWHVLYSGCCAAVLCACCCALCRNATHRGCSLLSALLKACRCLRQRLCLAQHMLYVCSFRTCTVVLSVINPMGCHLPVVVHARVCYVCSGALYDGVCCSQLGFGNWLWERLQCHCCSLSTEPRQLL
jgi:hypothetical protein